ncbi:Cu2+-exporting ATPase [Thalassococcus halodurans]|uniref:Cu2+-exporting ATPase n=1 Tax=Thalassococcus halodurans TaxID=373675 RepID=A0A1H5ZQN1_9RHOB|nr:heavy metal translocating P-type ATPase [Thalassococcus halodurans]SEG38065.1 Cu2+-exporting ATPase [Thalassococcus halodurans]
MTISACPACTAAPMAESTAQRGSDAAPTHELVLPHIHCAGCIRTVETVLANQPGIQSARVNLTQKRARIVAVEAADPLAWIDALSRAGIEAHESTGQTLTDDAGRALIVRLGVSGFAMMNVMLLSVAVWSGATDATRDMFHWISASIALPAAIFSAQPFFVNAWSALRVRRLNMDVPISLAILLACGMSLYEVMAGGDHAYFDAALSLTFFLLAGRVLDQRMRRAARSAAKDLAAMEPTRVTRIEEGHHVSRPLTEIAVGDQLWLTAGSRLPVDGTLDVAEARLDRSMLTGESDPVMRHRGAALQAGETVLGGPIQITATAVGEDTTLRRMARLVGIAESAKSAYTGLADRAAAIYAPAVHLIAFGAFVGWVWATSDIRLALNIAVATLIITCPCALGLAVPAVATAATGRLFRNGMLVTSDTALERLAEVDVAVFDKTGTLTRAVLLTPDTLPDDLHPVLLGLAQASHHPLAQSLVRALGDVTAAKLTDIREVPGEGVSADWFGAQVWLGRDPADNSGDTVFCVNDTCYALPRSEELLPNAREVVGKLKTMGLPVYLLTGDRSDKAQAIAQQLGVDGVTAGVTPEDKLRQVTNLTEAGHKVLMVGDGLNDTGAMAAAHASIAPGSALEASRNAADVVIVSGALTGVTQAIATSRSARKRILENFGLAASYNAVAIPLALMGFATPLMAALAMSLSSVTVILNALRLKDS